MPDINDPAVGIIPPIQPTILIVDDEEGVLNALRRLLRREGYNIVCAGSAEEGLRVLQQQPIDLVISDQRMPQMEGTVFLQKVKERWPDTLRVILSGYAEPALIVESINKGEVYRFFPKPWDDDELRAGIRQCVSHHQLQAENRRLMRQVREQNEDLRRMNLQLEDMVQARTLSLQLAQEIVEAMPVCVFGIGAEEEVLLCNATAQRTVWEWSNRSFLHGDPADEVLPAPVYRIVQQAVRSEQPYEDECCLIGDVPYYIFCRPLEGEKAQRRGTLLVLRDLRSTLRSLSGVLPLHGVTRVDSETEGRTP